jgi:sugar lactone lactonase YvrE
MRPIFLAALLGLAASASGQQAPAPLKYQTTWLGNSLGGPTWVQNFVQGLYVAPDGTVYAASDWDEAGQEFGIYRDGQVIGQAADTHGWGFGGGRSVCANAHYLVIAHSLGNEKGHLRGPDYPPEGKTWYGISRRTKQGQHAPFESGRGRFKDMLVLHEIPDGQPANLPGLAIDAKGKLYVSDPQRDEVRVIDLKTMKPQASIRLARPRQLAFDPSGRLWGIQAAGSKEPARVVLLQGQAKKPAFRLEFEPQVQPSALAFDPLGRLLVADNGPGQQIVIYTLDEDEGAWSHAGSFGETGGIYAGPISGRAGPTRLSGPTGVGTDAEGNLYVGCNQPGGGTILRSFRPEGSLRWELLGLEFVETADPSENFDGVDAFTVENRYTLDWSKTEPGSQWTWRAQTVDPFRFPNDPRLHEGHHHFCAPLERKLDGKRFLVVRGMFEAALVFYAVQKEDEIARPSVMVAKGPYRAVGWSPPGMPENSRWIWTDTNGDGNFEADEFHDADGRKDPESWAWWVDVNGDIWQGDQTGETPIHHFKFGGLDGKGNPQYRRENSESLPLPKPLVHLLRIEYHARDDVMYLTGYTADRPKTGDEWGQVGTEILRYEDWSKPSRSLSVRIPLPYDPAKKITVKSFCSAADLAFAVESRSAAVHVYDNQSGRELGVLKPGPEVGGESGWVDFPDAIRAIRRLDGEYLVFVEEDAKGKVLIYRFRDPRDEGGSRVETDR